ncbi:nuclear pore complex-interacting protein family member A3-like, partial [Hylobates moloch]|uniref:nuclear pore complex-interacting protein family member A3-like n=1 Tax=Hylobates moloch TaxID=81572 RepID=UPI0026752017
THEGLSGIFHKDEGPEGSRVFRGMWSINPVPLVRMAAVEHHHSSGLPYWPYLTAEALRKRKGRQAPPPTQCHLGADDFVSLKTPPDCLLVPLPPSSVDDSETTDTSC